MKKISLLTCSAALLWPLSLSAQTCTTPPSCDTLGYKQAASDCSGQQMLKCPFDNSKVFCGGVACSEDYALTSCDTSIGYCATCGGKYKYTSCNTGWYLSNGKCIENACSGYPVKSCDSNRGTCSTSDYCMKGSTKYYKYISCKTNAGWMLSNGNCIGDYKNCRWGQFSYCGAASMENESQRLADGPVAYCWYEGKKYVYNTSCTSPINKYLLWTGECSNTATEPAECR